MQKQDKEINIKLSPPQWILFHKIKSALGADPTLTISDMYLDQQSSDDKEVWYIDIISPSYSKAIALAALIVPHYQFSNIEVIIRVYYKNTNHLVGSPDLPVSMPPKIAAKLLIEKAFRENPLFITVFPPEMLRTLASNQKEKVLPMFAGLVLVFKKEILQYWADDISDFFGNQNIPAANVFKDIMYEKLYDEVDLAFTTMPDIGLGFIEYK